MSAFPPHGSFSVLRVTVFAALLGPCVAWGDTASDIRDFTGAPTRVVWIQDAGPTACVYSEKPTLRLMGFDTEDGKGERPILPAIGWYAKPQLTADGNRVIFHNLADNTVNVVNFDGTGQRVVVKNAGEFEDDATWTDPQTGVVWVYAQIMEQRGGQPVPTIRRFQMDHPEISELIWDKAPAHMFMLSGDGRAASGGIGNGGNTAQGVFTLPNGDFYLRTNGCWPSMSPDSSHRSWVFTGSHRSIHFCTPTDRSGTANLTGVRFDQSPGLTIKLDEEMYHPRWTNNVRYMCLDAPFSQWSWTSDAKIPMDVAAKVEIYIGKFNSDFTGMEKFVQVTTSKGGNYWPNVWIKPSKEDMAALASGSAPELPEAKAPVTLDTKGQIYTWLTGADGNQLANPATGTIHVCSGQLKHNARYAPYEVMDLTDGAFVPDDATAAPLLAACKASNQFAVETEITPTGPPSAGEKIIMAFADDPANGNFVLAQQGDMLTLRLKTDGAGTSPQSIPLARLIQNQPNHLIVSYADGKLACFVNGKPAILPNPFHGGLSNWTTQPLIFGDAWKGGQNWTGLMEDIGLFSREIDAPEAMARYLKQRERTAPRKPIDTLVVEAKLTGRCPAADPQGIAPYRRCLSVQLYDVEKVISGTCDDKQITVAQWSVLDGQVVPSYTQMAVGQAYQLTLQKMDDRPEQQSERSISGDFKAPDTIQLYYDTINPVPAVATTSPTGTNDKPYTLTAVPGLELNLDGQPSTVTTTTLKEVTFDGKVRMAGSGAVVAAAVLYEGFDYTQSPQVQFSGGGGQGATAEATMSIASLERTAVGSGYTSAPTVTLSEPDVAGGRQATATAQIAPTGGTLGDLTLTDPGSGYLRAPRLTFSGGGGTGAAAEATLRLSKVIVTNGGSGYTTPPKITLTGGDGEQASAQAVLQETTLRYTGTTGNAVFTNTGTLDQDGAALVFEGTPSMANASTFSFTNSGTWTLQNAASVAFRSLSAPAANAPSNTGTLRLKDGSSLGFASLQNSGEIDLGVGAVLGQAGFASADNTLKNTGQGIVKVIGSTLDQPATFGYAVDAAAREQTGKRILENGTADGKSAARFILGDGTDSSTFTVLGGQDHLSNFAGGTFEINPGATLAMLTNNNGTGRQGVGRDARLTNAGDLLLAGLVRVQGNLFGFTGIENSGTLTIRGDKATLENLKSTDKAANVTKPSCIVNQPGGLLQGSGKLTYLNSTEKEEGHYLQLTNSGTIAPGERAMGQTPESYGALTLQDANVYFGAFTIPPKPPGTPENGPPAWPIAVKSLQPGTLRIGIGGPPSAPDQFDSLTLTGDGVDYFGELYLGQLTLIKDEGNTLNIVPRAGYTPHGTYRIVTATSVTGMFDTLQYNGAAQAPYIVNYLPDGIEVVFP